VIVKSNPALARWISNVLIILPQLSKRQYACLRPQHVSNSHTTLSRKGEIVEKTPESFNYVLCE